MNKEELYRRLLARTTDTADQVDRDITAALGTTGAVLVCDSSGFTTTTRRRGILHFLSLLIRSYQLTIPLVEAFRGTVIKHEADNLIAIFDGADQAVRCAVAVQDAHHRWNATAATPDDRFEVCIGVAFGPFLRLSDDVFGDTVNVAYKLGEDLAGRGEILVTEPVARALAEPLRAILLGTPDVGHVAMEVYRIETSPN